MSSRRGCIVEDIGVRMDYFRGGREGERGGGEDPGVWGLGFWAEDGFGCLGFRGEWERERGNEH